MALNTGTSSIAELPFNNVPLNTVEDSGNKVIENKIQNEINNRDQQIHVINNDSQQQNNQSQLDYNSMINDLQKASESGATTLPSRDIPMNTQHLVQDQEIKPNFIPENNEDYIGDNVMIDNNINNYNNNISRLDDFYNTLQMPLLLSILYFIFQLPIVKKYLFKYLPNLFNNDGNQNIYGYIFYSIMFGISYILINNLLIKLNEI